MFDWGTTTWIHGLQDLHRFGATVCTRDVDAEMYLQMPHLAVRYVRWVTDDACYVTTHALHWLIPRTSLDLHLMLTILNKLLRHLC